MWRMCADPMFGLCRFVGVIRLLGYFHQRDDISICASVCVCVLRLKWQSARALCVAPWPTADRERELDPSVTEQTGVYFSSFSRDEDEPSDTAAGRMPISLRSIVDLVSGGG